MEAGFFILLSTVSFTSTSPLANAISPLRSRFRLLLSCNALTPPVTSAPIMPPTIAASTGDQTGGVFTASHISRLTLYTIIDYTMSLTASIHGVEDKVGTGCYRR